MPIRHALISTAADDPSLPDSVRPSAWNADHVEPPNRLIHPPQGHASIDEFDDADLDSAWVRVDESGTDARVTWVEGPYSQLSVRNTGGDAANRVHGLVRPLGSSVQAGDIFEARMTHFGPAANYTMGGIILSDGTTYGTGHQVFTLNMITGTVATISSDVRGYMNWTTQNSNSTALTVHQQPIIVRLVCVTASTWRCDISPDGVQWISTPAATKAVTPTHVGLWSSSWGTSVTGIMTYDYLRRSTL